MDFLIVIVSTFSLSYLTTSFLIFLINFSFLNTNFQMQFSFLSQPNHALPFN